MKEYIKNCKHKNICPICRIKFPPGDMLEQFIIENFGSDNVAVEICKRHYIAPAIITKSHNQNYDYNLKEIQ